MAVVVNLIFSVHVCVTTKRVRVYDKCTRIRICAHFGCVLSLFPVHNMKKLSQRHYFQFGTFQLDLFGIEKYVLPCTGKWYRVLYYMAGCTICVVHTQTV